MAETTARDMLVDVIRESGLSIEDFSRDCVGRSRATVYRWLQGASPIPDGMVHWLERSGMVVARAVREEQGGGQ